MHISIEFEDSTVDDFATSTGSPKAKQFTQTVPPAATQTRIINASLILESEQLLGQVSPDDDEIDDQINVSFLPWLNQFSSSDPLSLINISGDEDLQLKIRQRMRSLQQDPQLVLSRRVGLSPGQP